MTPCEFLSRSARAATPTEFQGVLIAIARQAQNINAPLNKSSKSKGVE